jgi:hypothetical protein
MEEYQEAEVYTKQNALVKPSAAAIVVIAADVVVL